MHGMLGNTIDKDDDHKEDGRQYEEMGRFYKLMLFSYRNSVADSQVPDNEYWQLYLKDGQDNWKVALMTAMIWLLWLWNNVYMVIILLNFLISIVSKAHDNANNVEI